MDLIQILCGDRFKLGMMIDTIVFYILMLVCLTMTLIQSHRSARKQSFCTNYLTKFSIDLNEIWHTVKHWCDRPHTHFSSSSEYSRERTLLLCFNSFFNINIRLYSHIYRAISFKLDIMVETTELYILISVWITLTGIQGHSCIKKIKALESIFFCKLIYLSIDLE